MDAWNVQLTDAPFGPMHGVGAKTTTLAGTVRGTRTGLRSWVAHRSHPGFAWSRAVTEGSRVTAIALPTICVGDGTATPYRAESLLNITPSKSVKLMVARSHRANATCVRCIGLVGRNMVTLGMRSHITAMPGSDTLLGGATSRYGCPTTPKRLRQGDACGSIATSWSNLLGGCSKLTKPFITKTANETITTSRTSNCGVAGTLRARGSKTRLNLLSKHSGAIGQTCFTSTAGGC